MAADVTALVDQFVEKVNARRHVALPLEDVPEFLQVPSPQEYPDICSDWRILPADHTARIRQLETRMGRPFPSAFRELITRYSFPAFDCGPLTFFANTGLDLFHELAVRLFKDPHLSPVLLETGYVQIGNPFFPNYDPVCVASAGKQDGPVVQLEHEMIIQHGVIETVSILAPSFAELLNQLVHGDAMADEIG